MVTKETGMFCLNSTCTRQDEAKAGQGKLADSDEKLPEAAVITRVDNFPLTDEQAAKIKTIHERAAAEVRNILGWK